MTPLLFLGTGDCNNIAHVRCSKSLMSKLCYQHKVFENNTKLNDSLEKLIMVVDIDVTHASYTANNLKSAMTF